MRKRLRTCPICRVAMLSTATGWSCPQCGSTIVDTPAKGEQREPDGENSAPAPVGYAV